MPKKMLIDATHAEETRVVVVDGNKVEEFDFESENKRQLAGNIYLAKVTRVEPSLQAAFVDYGGNRHGFLAFSEIHPDYYQIPIADRQALMEEEEAYAEAQQRQEDEEDAPKKRGRGRRERSKAQTIATEDAVQQSEVDEDQVSGMETINLTDESEISRAGAKSISPETVDADDAAVAGDNVVNSQDDSPKGAQTIAAQEIADEKEQETIAEAAQVSGDQRAAGSSLETSDEPEFKDADNAGDERKPSSSERDETIESISDDDDTFDLRPARKPRPRRYKIQEVVKVRQIMLVQVVKEERGNKGAALTTYLSLAGRYCVLMPNTARGGGISRKITNVVDRKKLKEIAQELEVPKGAGLIIRTAGAKRTKTEIKRDCEYLQRMWEQIRELTLQSMAPAKIYEEGDLIKRSIRDLYNREIDEVLIEGDRGYRIAKDFMKMIMPSHAKNVKSYQDAMPLFARYQVESYLSSMFNPTVQLKSGGYIVIGVTEALVAVDVNSGRATKEGSIEDTALKTNLEAAEEVARQLRLRDLAGLIVIDFIDMDERKNNLAVEKRIKDKLKSDRARIQVGRISGFGLLEMSRQRLRPGMIEATTQPCQHCHGTGLIRSEDNLSLSILRQIEEEGVRRRSREVLVKCPVVIANFLINQKRDHIAQIEARYGLSVRIEAHPHLISPDFEIEKFKTATRFVPEASMPVISAEVVHMEQVEEDVAEQEAQADLDVDAGDSDAKPKKRRRRRRRRKSPNEEADNASDASTSLQVEDNGEASTPAEETPQGASLEEDTSAKTSEPTLEAGESAPVDSEAGADLNSAPTATDEKPKPARKRTRKPRAAKGVEAEPEADPANLVVSTAPTADLSDSPREAEVKPKPKRAPRKTKKQKEAELKVAEAQAASAAEDTPKAPQSVQQSEAVKASVEPKPKKRGWWSRGS
ncbi:Rne/Rng family ribonuclease [Rhodobacteraceae bacterium IMCC15231]|nr:Rne/Rng family ribonuclease [Rhodobacteraceae bacterium IMCC15231]